MPIASLVPLEQCLARTRVEGRRVVCLRAITKTAARLEAKVDQNDIAKQGEMAPVISVVATFHNIDAALVRHCIDSLIHQHFDYPYELILVDDCSTDDTPAVLREYVSEKNVRLIELQENVGPGGARNIGIESAKAELVTIVDGDDFVSPYYLALLFAAKSSTGAELVAANSMVIPFDKIFEKRNWSRDSDVLIMDRAQYLEALCYEKVDEAPSRKLAQRGLYLRHPFPAKASYEDVAIASEQALACSKFAFVKAEIYGYVMRPGSVVHKSAAPFRQAQDFAYAIEAFLRPIEESHLVDEHALAFRRCLELSRLHSLLRVVSDCPEKTAELDQRAIQKIRESLPVVVNDKSVSRGYILRFWLLSRAPSVYDKAFSLYEAIKKGVAR